MIIILILFLWNLFFIDCKFFRWYLCVLCCERLLRTKIITSASVFTWRNFCVPVSLISGFSWCPSSRNRRYRTSVYWQNTSDTSFIFWTHLLNRDIVTNNIQMNKISMSIQWIAVKKKSRMWDFKNIDQTSISHFSDRQILCSSRVFDPYQKELNWYHFCWCNDVTGWISAVILYDS